MASKGAEFIGIDDIVENLRECQFDGIGVYQGSNKSNSTQKWKRIALDGENEEDLIEQFIAWSDRLMKSNPLNCQVYNMQLFTIPEGKTNAVGTSVFTFKFNDKSIINLPSNEHKQSGTGSISKRELELALENQRLEFEKHLLEKKLEDEEVDDEDFNEGEEIGMIGALQNAVVDKLPQLIDLVIARLSVPVITNQSNNNQMNLGIGANIDQIISELRKVDADIESDLMKLLQLAKTNPKFFQMLIQQLRSL
jgi:hypothetical protein